jgi:hypothetical protein
MKSKLFFDHIPKSAGTSISKALEDIFSEKNLISEFNNQHSYTIKTYRESNYLGGHIWFRQYEQLDSERYYCTILRDPIDRFLSQYSFHRQIAASLTNEGLTKDLRLADPQVLAATGMDIKQYILSPIPALINSYSNVQARHFAQRYCSSPIELSDEALLEAAIRSLEEYDLVGTFDYLQNFIDQICVDFSKPSKILPLLNKTDVKITKWELDSQLIKKLEETNSVDIKLVAWAKNRLKKLSSVERSTQLKVSSRENALDYFHSNEKLKKWVEFGNQEIKITSISCIGSNSGLSLVESGEEINILIYFVSNINEEELTIGIAIRDDGDQLIYGTNSALQGHELKIKKQDSKSVVFTFKALLSPGKYHITAAVHKGVSHEHGNYHWVDNAANFIVRGYGTKAFVGAFDLQGTMRVDPNYGG